MQTTGLAAQYGLHPSGTVNIVTKSGGNQFHGGVFEFLRNNYANASNRISGKVDQLKRNQYGAYLGGPIFKDKTFFFGGFQGTALRISPSTLTANIPTAAAISGNWTPYFQALQANAGGVCPFSSAKLLAAGFTTANTATCTATISPTLYDPVGLKLQTILPTSSTLDALGTIKYSVPQPQNENQWIGRIDHTISPRQNAFARYFMSNYSSASIFNGNLLNNINAALIDRDKSLTLGHNFTVTPSLTNSLRVSGNRLAIQRTSAPDLPNFADLGANVTSPVANFLYVSVTGGFIAACGTCSPTHIDTNQLQAADDVSFVHGNHFIQAGADLIHQSYNGFGFNNQNGQFFFTGAYSGYGLVDLLLGAPSSFSQANGGVVSQSHYRQLYQGYYAQDTYHPVKNLTLNVGLRWEPWLPTTEKNNKGQSFSQANFNGGTVSSVYTNAPAGLVFNGDKGVPQGFINKKMLNFSPRLGVAFDPTGSGRQSIRASYSLLFDLPSVLQSAQAWAAGVPYGQSQTITLNNASYQHSFANPWQGVSGGNPFPTPFPPTSTVAFPTAGITPQADQPGQRLTYMHQYNVSYQYQVTPKWLASATYLGTHTVHLWGYFPINYDNFYAGTSTGVAGSCGTLTPVPAAGVACSTTSNTTQRYKLYQQSGGTGSGTQYGFFSALSDYGMANYNGLILTANHQVSHNFTLLANYTYSRCLSNENFSGDNTPVAQNPNDLADEYGPCNFDVKHNITVTSVITSPKFNNHALNYAAGAWQVSPYVTYRTGLPFSVTSGVDASLSGIGQDRPNVVAGVARYNKNFYPGTSTNYPQWFNATAFVNPTPGTFGNMRPFSLRGPGYTNVDIAISKPFAIYERAKLEIRGEAFNLLNHPNYSNPISALSSSATVGKITSTANDARLLQIAAKITF